MIHRDRVGSLSFLIALTAAACGPDNTTTDSGRDVATDARDASADVRDAAPDARDAGPDVFDAGNDVPTDSPTDVLALDVIDATAADVRDATPEAAMEAGIDAGTEAGVDAAADVRMDVAVDAAADVAADVPFADVVHPAPGTHLIINEIDYDQVMTDAAEFVEIYNPTAAPISLAGYQLMLVNGSGGAVYTTTDLSPAGTLGAGQYLVVGATMVVSTVPTGTLTIDLGAITNAIQNGSPDAVALVNTGTNTLVDALSYEGSITSANLTGLGVVSLVEGTPLATSVADSNTGPGSLSRLPNATDMDNAATDWNFTTTPTPGAANVP